ncbi:hypothetical protein BKA64DRAFT_203557 [Cadophora sp. MPI-SDFR-AT-0126]|nr:hypothetical protein BKA64DRAFT_203557 [Leotiomycetes sp. MPI-SDFR-AT-0126]
MFSNQIPDQPNFGREPIQAATPELTNPIPELYPQPKEQEQGWGGLIRGGGLGCRICFGGRIGRRELEGWWRVRLCRLRMQRLWDFGRGWKVLFIRAR